MEIYEYLGMSFESTTQSKISRVRQRIDSSDTLIQEELCDFILRTVPPILIWFAQDY